MTWGLLVLLAVVLLCPLSMMMMRRRRGGHSMRGMAGMGGMDDNEGAAGESRENRSASIPGERPANATRVQGDLTLETPRATRVNDANADGGRPTREESTPG